MLITTRTLQVLAPATLLLGLLSTNATAQSGHKLMISDDGSGPMVFHVNEPDYQKLKRPDYERRDLPVIIDKLHLNETQGTVASLLLDGYLDAFKELIKTSFPAKQNFFAHGEPGVGHWEQGGPAEGIADSVLGALNGENGELDLSDLADLDLDLDMSGGGEMSVMIAVGAGSGGGMPMIEGDDDMAVVVSGEADDEAVGDSPSVMIAVDTPEGVELPPELMERLEKQAAEMVEKLTDQMDEDPQAFVGDMVAPNIDFEARQAAYDEINEQADMFEAAKKELTRQFESDLLGQLTSDQFDYWPSLERALTRTKTLPGGRLDAESTDLFKVFDRLETTEADEVAVTELFDAYELALHTALVRRNAFLPEANDALDKAMSAGQPDKALSAVDRATELRKGVQRVNLSYSESIAQQLHQELGEAFQQTFREMSFPRVYRTTVAQRAFDAVRGLPNITPELETTFDSIETVYNMERTAIDDRIRRAILKHQPSESRKTIESLEHMFDGEARMTFSMTPPDPDELRDQDPIQAAFGKRRDLDERFMKQLYGLLPDEQVATLPKLPSQREHKPFIIRKSSQPQ